MMIVGYSHLVEVKFNRTLFVQYNTGKHPSKLNTISVYSLGWRLVDGNPFKGEKIRWR